MTPLQHLERAVEMAGGTPADLARAAAAHTDKKIERAHVWNWLNRDKSLPGDYVLPVAKAIGFAITPHEFRPDLYPNPKDGLPPRLRKPKH